MEMKQLYNTIHGAGRSQSVDGRQTVQCWIGHEAATNHCETVPNHHEDCRERIRSSRGSELCDRAYRDSPDSVCRETRLTRLQYIETIMSTVPARRYRRSLKCQQRCNAQRYSDRTPPHSTTGSIPLTGRSEHREG